MALNIISFASRNRVVTIIVTNHQLKNVFIKSFYLFFFFHLFDVKGLEIQTLYDNDMKKKTILLYVIIIGFKTCCICILFNSDCRIVQIRYTFVLNLNGLKYKNLNCIFSHILPLLSETHT